MRILYSYNKRGYEAAFWAREIAAASTPTVQFIPFNHDRYIDPALYIRAQLLDNQYFARDSRLLHLYSDFEREIARSAADAVIVDNCFPYHPEFLRKLPIYKAMRTSDGPLAAYDRDFAYLHAYDHILYHSPAYSRDLTMEEKLRYCGAQTIDWWPLGVFQAAYDARISEEEVFAKRRDVGVVFVGAMHVNKMPLLARIKKTLGSRIRMYGLTNVKRNVYFNLKYGLPGWIRPLPFEGYVQMYQRAQIGINIHNRGEFTVGNYRMFELPANGVCQLSDGGRYLESFFEPGREIVGYADADDLLTKIDYYLTHDSERVEIARNGFRRVMRDYRIIDVLGRAALLIEGGMKMKAERQKSRREAGS